MPFIWFVFSHEINHSLVLLNKAYLTTMLFLEIFILRPHLFQRIQADLIRHFVIISQYWVKKRRIAELPKFKS